MRKILQGWLLALFVSAMLSSAYAEDLTYCSKEQATLSPNVCGLYDKWIDAIKDKKLEQAEVYFKWAKVYATSKWEVENVDAMLAFIADEYLKKTTPSEDTYSYKQYYLKTMNIPAVWNTVGSPKQVVVAVIDDWLDISQPDLIDSIWVDPSASYWASKVKDFVGDKLTNYASGEHGTMVAGIIWASTNNSLWIAGIAKNVKIMPLRVFPMTWSGWAKEENIINAMNYAIDNGANIINLSLGKSQFAYSANFDAVIKKAASKNIITVIAAGNWDAYTNWAKGLDLSISPISPVCNNGGKNNKLSIWVGSIDKEWRKSEWSNFGNCVNFWAPGEGIVSTSIPLYSDGYRYDIKNGTSFSAPIIAGIVALWYNKYGSTSPEIVFDSLTESLSDFNYSTDNANFTKLKDRTQTVDAAKYLEILGRKITEAATKKPTTTEVKPVVPVTDTKKPLTYFESLAASGVITVQSTESGYRLNDKISRAEIVKIAIKLSGKSITPCSGKIYSDVTSDLWDLCGYIETAAQAGMISKKSLKFRPLDLVTRAEMAKILLSAKNIPLSTTTNEFKDVWESMGDLAQYINTASAKGFIPKADFFQPTVHSLRSEVFQLAYKLIK